MTIKSAFIKKTHSGRAASPITFDDYDESLRLAGRAGLNWEESHVGVIYGLSAGKPAWHETYYLNELQKQPVLGDKMLSTSRINRLDLSNLKKQVDELKLQIKKIQEQLYRKADYEDVEIPDDELEAYLCGGSTYRKKFPNSFLAIDVKARKVLITSPDENVFIKELRQVSGVDELRVIDTFGGVSR